MGTLVNVKLPLWKRMALVCTICTFVAFTDFSPLTHLDSFLLTKFCREGDAQQNVGQQVRDKGAWF